MNGCSVRKSSNHRLRYAIRRLSCRTLLGLTNLKLSRRSTWPASWPEIQLPAGLSLRFTSINAFPLRLSKAFSNCPLQRQDKGDCFAKVTVFFFCWRGSFFSEPSICARQCSLAFLLMLHHWWRRTVALLRLCLKRKVFFTLKLALISYSTLHHHKLLTTLHKWGRICL